MDVIISIEFVRNREEYIKIFGNNFVKNNKSLDIFINGNINKITTNYKLESDEINMLTIEFKYNNNISDISYMFEGCKDFEYLEICWPDTSKIININYVFKDCQNLKDIKGLSKWNTENVKSMVGFFYGCFSLESLPDISEWSTENVIDMSYLFYECCSLESLPDISKWNIKNVNNINHLLYDCSSLKSLPDISRWNIKKVKDISYLFYGCNSLTINALSTYKII